MTINSHVGIVQGDILRHLAYIARLGELEKFALDEITILTAIRDIQEEFIYNEPQLEQPSFSVKTLEQFSSENYQQLLTTMLSQISPAVLLDPELSHTKFLEDWKGCENRPPR